MSSLVASLHEIVATSSSKYSNPQAELGGFYLHGYYGDDYYPVKSLLHKGSHLLRRPYTRSTNDTPSKAPPPRHTSRRLPQAPDHPSNPSPRTSPAPPDHPALCAMANPQRPSAGFCPCPPQIVPLNLRRYWRPEATVRPRRT
ncbi:uncharacterized protein BO95DRAFT_444964 [Aspergillus brunneoviolaceus CBS 621.78]|uniref:Uncharacterized protein n=1 Tax=Aspergillus brunneoviolaceus CBS 621.78 TaxID=1450534 RepID=A0ACD1G2W1_9EURO|nr:hypothetical protein BO95DRAFT_444964 [Aspergillus brunneoviolaceus CBS 621.78]RAH43584.1 hypothetical protein BO95DRAFT_444964 [Aspergillus brunneoviolaceus CBS 621.78]